MNTEKQIIDGILMDWNKLDDAHKYFCWMAYRSRGSKHAIAMSSAPNGTWDPEYPGKEYEKSTPLWKLSEELGFAECVGSYKWVGTPKFLKLLMHLMGIDTFKTGRTEIGRKNEVQNKS